MTWILDLDGVLWLGEQPVAGAAAAVERLRAAGETVLFLTNNSSMTLGQYRDKLHAVGVAAGDGDVVSSALAAASLVAPGSTVLLCAGAGAEEALLDRGVTIVREGDADAVVVGWHRDFDFERLTAAFRAVHHGARLLATNDDPTYPAPDGLVPGAGAIVAAVATASGAQPVVAGKPHPPMVELVRARAGAAAIVVGDRPSTDGLLARRLGARFGLVLTGVTRAGDLPVEPAPDVVAADLAELVERELSGRGQ